MNWIKTTLKAVAYLSYLCVSTFVLLEITFRILPTANVFDVQKTDSSNPIIRFQKNEQITTSLGWNFYQYANKKTNNYGFVASKDYAKEAKPDLMVVGDSYVEAMQVDNEEALPEIIEKYEPSLTVYSIGISGVPLSQYIKFVEYAEEEFDPREYLIVVVGNDFDQSLCDVRPKQGTFCFNKNWDLTLIDFGGYSTLRQLARSSAFMRYVVFNAGLNWRSIVSKIGLEEPGLSDSAEFAGNTERSKNSDIESLSKRVVDEFIEKVTVAANGKKISLLIDADRQDIYANSTSDSYFRRMRNYLINQANNGELNVIDMEGVFSQHHQAHGNRFEFPTDGHWNELGHEVAARAYLSTR